MYIVTPIHEGDLEYYVNNDGNNIHITNYNYGDGEDVDMDDLTRNKVSKIYKGKLINTFIFTISYIRVS